MLGGVSRPSLIAMIFLSLLDARQLSAQVITEFVIPTPGAQPDGIAAGPDGALWFTEGGASKIGRITTSGVITEFSLPSFNDYPLDGIAVGSDGAIWFTEYTANKIGRISTAGQITEFAIPTPNSQPVGITAGPDGAVWFTEDAGNRIGRITTAGLITEFAAGDVPLGVAMVLTVRFGSMTAGVTRSAASRRRVG